MQPSGAGRDVPGGLVEVGQPFVGLSAVVGQVGTGTGDVLPSGLRVLGGPRLQLVYPLNEPGDLFLDGCVWAEPHGAACAHGGGGPRVDRSRVHDPGLGLAASQPAGECSGAFQWALHEWLQHAFAVVHVGLHVRPARIPRAEQVEHHADPEEEQ